MSLILSLPSILSTSLYLYEYDIYMAFSPFFPCPDQALEKNSRAMISAWLLVGRCSFHYVSCESWHIEKNCVHRFRKAIGPNGARGLSFACFSLSAAINTTYLIFKKYDKVQNLISIYKWKKIIFGRIYSFFFLWISTNILFFINLTAQFHNL